MRLTILFLLLFSNLASAQSSTARVRDSFKSMTVIENPFELRDPFRPPLSSGKMKEGTSEKSLMRDGVYTNIEAVEVKDIRELRIVGVMIGRERRALARVGENKNVIILREGMRIGSDNAELKAIHPGGVILVEKLVNVYGEEEFLETVIPISQ